MTGLRVAAAGPILLEPLDGDRNRERAHESIDDALGHPAQTRHANGDRVTMRGSLDVTAQTDIAIGGHGRAPAGSSSGRSAMVRSSRWTRSGRSLPRLGSISATPAAMAARVT